MDRRKFVGWSVSGACAASFSWLFWRNEAVCGADGLSRGEYLDLPEGFQCRVIDRNGTRMDDGFTLPGRPDGMACFSLENGDLVLMRNHELDPWMTSMGPYADGQVAPEEAFDQNAVGGVTRTVLDGTTGAPKARNLVLTGSTRNCAGGVSPWGWLSCEETVDDGHGYVFVCDPSVSSVNPARPVPSYGRFNHEAATVDPRTLVAYLTEDRGDGCFYRFRPDSKEEPYSGQLQALRVRGEDAFDTAEAMRPGDEVDVDWITVEEPDSPRDDIRYRARERGACRVRRGEGLWLHEGRVYFSATSGGPAGKGQIFAFEPDREDPETGKLHLLAQAGASDALEMPDNLTVAPWGDVFIAEDSSGIDHVRILTPDGNIKTLAKNTVSNSEIAGVCFSPDGSTLFMNLQEDGLTLAVRGPFQEFARS